MIKVNFDPETMVCDLDVDGAVHEVMVEIAAVTNMFVMDNQGEGTYEEFLAKVIAVITLMARDRGYEADIESLCEQIRKQTADAEARREQK